MSRRRRLAMRQVAEPEMRAALSDVEDDPPMAEPNFNLLGMMQAAETAAAPAASSLPQASTQPLIYVDDDGDHEMDQAPTQVVSSTTCNGSAEQPAKKPRVDGDRVTPKSAIRPPPPVPTARVVTVSNDPASRDVFQLYQKGLGDDHTLRLHFMRRRPPPPPSTPIEDDFVLPRPQLSIFDLLPARTTSISDILCDTTDAPKETEAMHLPPVPMDEILQTATTHWRQLEAAPDELLLAWRSFQECDWIHVYHTNGSIVPTPRDLIRVLQTLRSDAFALFVWHELLLTTAQALYRDKAAPSEINLFTTALLSREVFRHLPAKEFRAQLRAKNLRASISGDATDFAMALELELIAQFHKFRKTGV